MRKLQVLLVAPVLALTAFLAAPGISQASTIKPLPTALSGHPFATEKDATQLLAWGIGPNQPGNCRANTKEIQGDAANFTLFTTGATNDCTDIESPHTYPTVNGYVYESRMYFSNFTQWAAYWMYGNTWPNDGETDAVEANFDQNCFSYHYGTVQDEQYKSTCYNAGITPVSANITPGWHTVDIAYGTHSVSIYYDGNLYATVSGSEVVNGPSDPSWLTWGTGSCNAAGNNVCANGKQGPGYLEVQWLKIFT